MTEKKKETPRREGNKRGFKSNSEKQSHSDYRASSTDAYDLQHKDQTPRIEKIIRGLPSLKKMIIFKEIIDLPKCLRFPE